MVFLVLGVHSTNNVAVCRTINAWVNLPNKADAMHLLGEELSLQGWVVEDVVEVTHTQENDYFPPCTSLDAYKEAQKSVFVIRFV